MYTGIKSAFSRTTPILQKRVLLFLLVLICVGSCLLLAGCNLQRTSILPSGPSDQAASEDSSFWERKQALNLYHETWQVVFTEYVDPSFNGQNWYRWKDKYNHTINTYEDAYVAIRTMLASLNDPYSRFLDPKRAKDQNMHIDSRLFGVGIQIADKDNHLVVIAPLEDSPAERAGIQPMDQIVEINGDPTANMTIDDAVEKIRGPKGTPVTLTLLRADKRVSLRLIRDEIVIKTVFGEPVSKDIGYIRLSSFISQDTTDEMRKKLETQKHTKALIIDIRGNNGGLLPNALDISDMFLRPGKKIVSIVDRSGTERAFNAKQPPLYDKPVAILIDEGSASASEIFAGAMENHNRAVLIGSHTFGKGLVQKINYLSDGSELNLTISKYFTPDGQDINQTGIKPNIEVPITLSDLENNRDPQKEAAIRYLKKQMLANAS